MSIIPARMAAVAASVGERPLLTLLYPGHAYEYSYNDVLARARKWASALRVEGLVAGDHVVVIVPHSLDTYAAFLGALIGGFVPAMFAFPSPKLSVQEYFKSFEALLNVTQAVCVVVYEELANTIDSIGVKLPGTCRLLRVAAIENAVDDGVNVESTIVADDVAFLQFSSGTTGLKKGVEVSHRALLWQVDSYARAIRLSPEDVIVSWLPLYHDMGLITCLLLPFLTGTRLVAMSPFDWVKQPQMLLRALHDYRGTLCWLPNFAYNLLANTTSENEAKKYDLCAVRGFVNCSEPIMAESHELFLRRFAVSGVSESALAASYAMAENTFAVTSGGLGNALPHISVDADALTNEARAKPSAAGGRSRVVASSGRVLPGVKMRVVDDAGTELSPGSLGELWIQGPCLFAGYKNNPEATASSFADTWYRTGDIGFEWNEELFVVGRKKDLIIIGGKNIFPQDLEALINSVRGVVPGRCVALGISNTRSGTEDLVIIAEAESSDLSQRAELMNTIFAEIASSTEVRPSDVFLVEPGWLRKSTSGKIARNENRARYLEVRGQERESAETGPDRRGEATVERVRRRVFNVVQQTSRLAPQQLRDHTALFSSGIIDSLSLATLLTELEEEFSLELPDDVVNEITALDSIEKLAHRLDQVSSGSSRIAANGGLSGRDRALRWHQRLSKQLMSFESRRRYELAPQLQDSDVISNDPDSEFGRFTVPNFRSETMNTDDAGFRVCVKDGKILSRAEFFNLPPQRGVVAGNSAAFSVGATSDALAMHNRLNAMHGNATTWYNLSLRASGLDSEAIAVERYVVAPVDYFVWFSGYNDLKYWVVEFAALLRDHLLKTGEAGYLSGEVFQRAIGCLDQRIVSHLSRCGAHMKNSGARMLFVLQPTLSWFEKLLTPEEDELVRLYDYVFLRVEARVGYHIARCLYPIYVQLLQKRCEEAGFSFLDANSLACMREPRWMFLDRIHLNDAGFGHMVDLIDRWIQGDV